jgi:hypothetical protein
MTAPETSETTFVVNDHVIAVALDAHNAPRSLGVSISLDGLHLRSFEEPGWRLPGYGVAGREFYWWSARRLVVVPVDAPRELREFALDEDILCVFARGDSWLLVCETSIRLRDGATEVSRLEFPEVVTSARVEGDLIVVEDAGGVLRHIAVSSERLTVVDSPEH